MTEKAGVAEIRFAEVEDAEIIAQFNCELAEETEDDELDLVTVTRGVTRFLQGAGAGFYIIAEIDKRIIGCLMVTHEWSDWRDGNLWWIQSVYVKAKVRRQGVFRSLFHWVQERAKVEADVCGIRLYVERDNERAQQTYESLGMKQKPYRIYERLVS
jgi:GNAT superfamily N-acetyltransferase